MDDQIINEPGTNEGACKVFAFAKPHKLNESETLSCFGSYYRDDVLNQPNGSDHANIRNFLRYGWAGIHFDRSSLMKKSNQPSYSK